MRNMIIVGSVVALAGLGSAAFAIAQPSEGLPEAGQVTQHKEGRGDREDRREAKGHTRTGR